MDALTVIAPPFPSSAPDDFSGSRDYDRMARAIAWLEAHAADQPDLEAVAAAVHLSPYHFQRLFTRWTGLSPKRFLGCLTLTQAKRVLAETGNILDTALDLGLSGPSRLHDLFVTHEAMSPGEVKSGGAGLIIRYGLHDGPFGVVLPMMTERGLCALHFLDQCEAGSVDVALEGAREKWPKARFLADSEATAPVVAALFPADGGRARGAVTLLLSGTNFQVKVWEAALRVPPGALVSYQAIARAIGKPGAARAVGNALGANSIGLLIPCHRVIRGTGALGDYRWGRTRKRIIQAWEQAAE
ncbi:MAG: methylated-DNA--[protein]-cysteine S-methyltransferase [Rhodospirillum sp.]|nr:methylated-DNA--[protein]-cysteine S-methyltransferase [Rhodospirillum sp.]MCF8487905.1 methylated-DNA--[protein]-cysteine S-methyltransferase [Rhodospirillum sp.]MCF8501457.1 methylated-DNA--[protein]-cysteine S-methyltransferase [Rhodospirillum sp.]